MFFVLSKTIGALTKPFSWLVVLLLIAVFWRKPKTKKISLVAALAVLLVFTNPILFNFAVKLWEPAPVAPENLHIYDFGIVLGGFSHHFPECDNVELTAAGDRLWQTVSLYKQGKIKKILISGGSGWGTGKPEASAARDVLVKMGISADDVLAESDSRNTHENAKYSAELIAAAHPGADCLLITSALHTPRALACFRKVGINPDVFPADHLALYHNEYWLNQVLPDVEILAKWNRTINEWVGMVVYKVQGYI